MGSPTGKGAAFATYLARCRPAIEAYLAAHAPGCVAGTPAATARDLDRYLYEPLARFIRAGGKRTRPALTLLGCEAVGGNPELALPCAAAIESFQSAALVHDDIADRGELRRGVPCLHLSEGTGIAINVGDLALTDVVAGVLRDGSLDAERRLRLVDLLVVMEERTLEGQALDLGWVRDGRWDVSMEDYLYMASHKTAYYSAATPLAAGAICGDGTDAQVAALNSFGMSAGLAFQLQDDLLNLVGDAALQGKDFRSDITEGKRTLLVVWALSHLGQTGRDELIGILSSSTTDADELDRAVGLIDSSGAIDHVRRRAHDLAEAAKSALSGVQLATHATDVLVSMADFFVERTG